MLSYLYIFLLKKFKPQGEYSLMVRVLDCGFEGCGFESHYSPARLAELVDATDLKFVFL